MLRANRRRRKALILYRLILRYDRHLVPRWIWIMQDPNAIGAVFPAYELLCDLGPGR